MQIIANISAQSCTVELVSVLHALTVAVTFAPYDLCAARFCARGRLGAGI